MIENRMRRILTMLAAGCSLAAPTHAMANGNPVLLEGKVEVHPSALAGTSILSVKEQGRILEDAKPRKLISDELLEERIAAAKASVAPIAQPDPVEPALVVNWAASVPSQMPAGRVYLSSRYGLRTHPIHGDSKMHSGIDLAGVAGTPVYATADGRVQQAKWYGSYGLFVEIAHGGKLESRYAHLSAIVVAPGQRVRQGDVLGYIGSTGGSTGPHLHYEVRRNGQAINPVSYLFRRK